ncbi:MAG: hypothetical protein E7Z96_10700 [Actinomycetaceae bacterium]|nr:hypothetical protein [Actinomycetaceae bacterium]
MTTTNKTNSGNRLGGRGIAGICLAACGLLTIVWGGTVVPANVLDADFMSFVCGGLVVLAFGTCLITALPPALRIVTVWLAAVSLIAYMFILRIEVMVALIGCVPVIGFAAWISVKLWRAPTAPRDRLQDGQI